MLLTWYPKVLEYAETYNQSSTQTLRLHRLVLGQYCLYNTVPLDICCIKLIDCIQNAKSCSCETLWYYYGNHYYKYFDCKVSNTTNLASTIIVATITTTT